MNHLDLFDRIAPIYAWFYGYQRRGYAKAVDIIRSDYEPQTTLLDVGCGTGALSSLLSTHFRVTAIDGAPQMIAQAHKRHQGEPIDFRIGNILTGLPFDDHQFEVVITAFMLHGLAPEERTIALKECCRIASREVIILDYSTGRHWLIDAVERLENGHYFSFISTFIASLQDRPISVQTIPLSKTSALYRLTKQKTDR